MFIGASNELGTMRVQSIEESERDLKRTDLIGPHTRSDVMELEIQIRAEIIPTSQDCSQRQFKVAVGV